MFSPVRFWYHCLLLLTFGWLGCLFNWVFCLNRKRWSRVSSLKGGLMFTCVTWKLELSTDSTNFSEQRASLIIGLLNPMWPLASHGTLPSPLSRIVQSDSLRIDSGFMDTEHLTLHAIWEVIYMVSFYCRIVLILLCFIYVYNTLALIVYTCRLHWTHQAGEWAGPRRKSSARRGRCSCFSPGWSPRSDTWVCYSL